MKSSQKKYSQGVIQLVPALVVALIVALGLALAFSQRNDNQLGKLTNVLSERSGSSKDQEDSEDEDKVEGENDDEKDEASRELKIEAKGNFVRVRSREETGTRTQVVRNGRKVRVETEDGMTKVRIENEDEEVEEEVELEEDEEFELETDEVKIKIKSRNGNFVLREGEVEALTKFPLSIDLATNELIVTTPAGTRRVAVLPQQAIDNMIRVGHVTVIFPAPSPEPSAFPSASASPEVSPSASPEAVALSSVEIVEDGGQIVYRIRGARSERFLGVLTINIPRTLEVSAETGDLLSSQQSLIDRFLDLLSF